MRDNPLLLKIGFIQNEHGDPETWVDNKWILSDPMILKNLTRLSVGGLPVEVQGEMLYSQVRYFDGERRRSGLPPDVAAMVTRIEKDWIEIEVINLSGVGSRQLIIQAGAYGEHRFQSVDYQQAAEVQPPVRDLRNPRHRRVDQAVANGTRDIHASAFAVDLAPGSGSTLRIQLERNVEKPSYAFPWDR